MEYNTQNPKIKIREYGRNLQKLIDHAATIEDDEVRQQVAEGLVNLMNQLSPQSRTLDDQKAKLWHHLNIISEEKMKVETPEGVEFVPLDTEITQVEYPYNKIKFKHYGKNVETMIEAAKQMVDREKQEAFAVIIGSYMKMVNKSWNAEHVSSEVIIEDLKTLSGGILELPADANLDSLSKFTKKKRRSPNSTYKSKGSYSNNGSNNRRNNKYNGSYNKNKNNNNNKNRRRPNRS